MPPTVYLHNFGRTQVNSAFSCYLASATGWTFPKPPAILATLPVRWLAFRANSNLVVLLSISNGRTSLKSLAAQILFVRLQPNAWCGRNKQFYYYLALEYARPQPNFCSLIFRAMTLANFVL